MSKSKKGKVSDVCHGCGVSAAPAVDVDDVACLVCKRGPLSLDEARALVAAHLAAGWRPEPPAMREAVHLLAGVELPAMKAPRRARP